MKTVPYRTEMEWLNEELRWVEVRLRRLAAEAALDHAPTRHRRNFDTPVNPLQAERLRDEERRLRTSIDRRLNAWRASHGPTAFERLADDAGLDAFERQVLLLATAAALSSRFGDLFGDMGNFGSSLSPEIAFRFAGISFTDTIPLRAAFGADSRLLRNDLVAIDMRRGALWPDDLLGATLRVTSSAFNRIVGDARLDDAFLGFSRVEVPLADLDGVVLADEDKQRILSVVDHHDRYLRLRREWGLDEVVTYGRGLILLFHGAPGTGKTLTAHAIAKRLGMRVLNVDIPTFIEARENERFLPALFREARLRNAVLFFDECEVLFSDRRYGNTLMTTLLTEMERFEGVAILATNLPGVLDEALDRRILVKIRFPEPDREARAALWRRHLPSTVPLAADVDIEALAERFEVTGGYIKNAVLEAVAQAASDPGESPCLTMAHLETAARRQSRKATDEQQDLINPRTRLSDVVLTPAIRAQVEELVAAARGRRTVLDRWRIGERLDYGKGLAALFCGEPGTGKTLCAHAVAGELGRPLLEAAVPALLSRWVGESERNLAALFRQARTHGAVLFLDECDAILAERGADGARHDDRLVSVFLRTLERHDGLVLMATNREAALDRALSRRIAYRIVFPLPDAAARTEIWRGLLPDTVPTDGTVDLVALGRRYALSGGRIRNAVFKAAFRAASQVDGKVTGALLDQAAAEELAAAGGNGKGRVGFGLEVA